MTTFTSLPLELRQQILLAAIQNDQLTGPTWPKTILSLFQTCHLIQHDMTWVLTTWDPLWTLQQPTDLKLLDSTTSARPKAVPTIRRIRIAIFHSVTIKNMHMADMAMGHPSAVHPELVQAWIGIVSQLPKGVREVELDITPAPGWLRVENRPYQVHDLLLDNRTARCFMDEHVHGIAELVMLIHRYYDGEVDVRLVGTLSRRSERFISGVQALCMLGSRVVQWDGTYICADQGSAAQLQRIVFDLAPKRRAPYMDVGYWHRALRLEPLRKIRWSDRSVKLFGKACGDDEVGELREEIAEMAELMVVGGECGEVLKKMPIAEVGGWMVGRHDGTVETAPHGTLRRALLHSLAQDMGFRTASEGSDEMRHVVVMR